MSVTAMPTSSAHDLGAETRSTYPALALAPTSMTLVEATLEDLSPRERDVLTLVTNCYTNQEISESLYLSLNSVKTYIRGAYRKIGAPSRSHAVVWGVRHGLLEPAGQVPQLVAVENR